MTSWQSSIRANPGFAVSCRSFPNRSHSFQPASRPVLIACNFEFAGHPGIRRVCYRVGRGELLVSTPETPPAVYRVSASNFSLRILAAAVILLFFYYAAGVVITVLLSILLAYFLDPAVELLERMHVPRTVGAMVMVLLLIAVLVAVGYGLGTRT